MTKKQKDELGSKAISMEARRHLIISDIAKGMRYTDILHKYMKEWNLGQKSLELYIHDAIEFMRSDTAKENLIAMNMQRLDDIYTESRTEGDRKSAVKAIDTQNKMIGAYTEKVQIEGDTEITLNFDLGNN